MHVVPPRPTWTKKYEITDGDVRWLVEKIEQFTSQGWQVTSAIAMVDPVANAYIGAYKIDALELCYTATDGYYWTVNKLRNRPYGRGVTAGMRLIVPAGTITPKGWRCNKRVRGVDRDIITIVY